MPVREIKSDDEYRKLVELSSNRPVVLFVEMDGCIACYFAQKTFKSISEEFPDIIAAKIMKPLFYKNVDHLRFKYFPAFLLLAKGEFLDQTEGNNEAKIRGIFAEADEYK